MDKYVSQKIPSSEITSKVQFQERRKFIQQMAVATSMLSAPTSLIAKSLNSIPNKSLSLLGEKDILTSKKNITTYNNFYELGTSKSDPSTNAKWLKYDPWSIKVSGLIAKPGKIDMEDILKIPIEERVYRMRCVERWSMVIPWNGFQLSKLLKKFEPTSKAKYVEFKTIYSPEDLYGQRFPVLDWPYKEGLRIDEAMNPLTLLAVGIYGESLLAQNGAPIRLVVPWKYGFKGIKSIIEIKFTDRTPVSSWTKSAPHEYGFYANVNPKVHHPRWRQNRERRIGEFSKRKTLLFNGYEKEVAHLYKGMDLKKYY